MLLHEGRLGALQSQLGPSRSTRTRPRGRRRRHLRPLIHLAATAKRFTLIHEERRGRRGERALRGGGAHAVPSAPSLDVLHVQSRRMKMAAAPSIRAKAQLPGPHESPYWSS